MPNNSKMNSFLLAALCFGISYYSLRDTALPAQFLMAWKGAGVACLALYAFFSGAGRHGRLLAVVMLFGAIGDVLVEVELMFGALAFLIGHCFAIALFLQNRRVVLTPSQRYFAYLLVPVTIFVAWLIPSDRSLAAGVALYAAFLAVMAATAWTSRFSRYRVGVGALLFVLSDLLIFSQGGALQNSIVPELFIWPLYFAAQVMITTGVIQVLQAETAPAPGD